MDIHRYFAVNIGVNLHEITTLKISDFAITYPANIYLFKVNNRNTKKGCETCSRVTIKIPERRQ